jgi:hypothetical protein
MKSVALGISAQAATLRVISAGALAKKTRRPVSNPVRMVRHDRGVMLLPTERGDAAVSRKEL